MSMCVSGDERACLRSCAGAGLAITDFIVWASIALASILAVAAYWRRRTTAALAMVVGMAVLWVGMTLIEILPWDTVVEPGDGPLQGIYWTSSPLGGYVAVLGLLVFFASLLAFLVGRKRPR